MGSFTGQVTPIAESSQHMPDSPALLYVPVVRYSISAHSDRTQKPRAKPAGAHSSLRDLSSNSTPNHAPSAGEPFRISTATRNAAPDSTRMTLPIGGSHWKWSPRVTLRRDREWFSCTKLAGRPTAAYSS